MEPLIVDQSEGIKPQLPSFTQSGLDDFLKIIKERGHEKLVDAAILHGLSLSSLNSHKADNKEVRQLPFEGFEKLQQGGIYYGQCVDGMRDGYGLLYCTNRSGIPLMYLCQWEKGKPTKGCGLGILKDKWNKYEGHFDERYLRTGNGSWEDEIGAWYQGEFKAGMRNGNGKYRNLEGGVYEGQWKADKMSGNGKFEWPNGNIYEGQWKNSNLDGIGKLKYPNGSIYEGGFKDSCEHGQGKLTSTNGQFLVGEWENRGPIGVHNCFTKNGTLLYYYTYNIDGTLVKIVEIL
ncbi:hypothetical protein FGO68_gene10427 [Halteria grandinella]|uniref:MORN repeat protein n=1 Tax=Halteria grandinella TaxID=5974 RepID=A0A8J8NM77_HALGN|nr:hypothetical protein FGO68_gene10427 [Halteria grandinella]